MPESEPEENRERWEMIQRLFDEAVELPESERRAFVDSAGLDAGGSARLRILLESRASAHTFFDRLEHEIGSLLDDAIPFLEPGTVLCERFRIARLIAEGGMGAVYEAEDLELGGAMALKVMRRQNSGSLTLFRQEIRLARSVSSIHVCRVFDVSRDTAADGRDLVFFTMELLDGETISQRIARQGPFTAESARDVVRQMLEGLDAAHRVGILHRDFKSNNVMLCGEGAGLRAVITDFGLSQPMRESSASSEPLPDGMSPAYVAPEQLERLPESRATDIYSLGVVLFEMLTGELPFEGASPWELATSRLTTPPRAPRSVAPGIPRNWEAVILRCLERDPARRFKNALDAGRALGIVPREPLMNRRAWAGLAAASVAACSTALWKFRAAFAGLDEAPKRIAVGGFESSSELRYLADGLADRLSDELAEVPGLQVMARYVVEQLPGGPRDLANAGTRLKATHLLSGRLLRSGRRNRISVQLAGVESGVQDWSMTTEVDDLELEGASRQIARGLIHALRPGAPSNALSLARPLTPNGEAYQLYLLGRYHAARRDAESLQESVAALERAVTLDPNFAAAHAALASSLYHLSPKDGIPRAEYVSRANRESERALQLDPAQAEAHLVLAANFQFWEWDWKSAERHFRRAVELKPKLADAHHWYANMLYPLGRFREALTEIDAAAALDPLGRSLRIARGVIQLDAGSPDDAIAQLRLMVASDPAHSNTYVPLSCAYAAKGSYPEALQAALTAVSLTKRASFALSQLGHVYALAGKRADAEAIGRELEQRFRDGLAGASDLAILHAGFHDRDRTLEWLARALPARDTVLTILKVDPQFVFLRGDSRFHSLLAQVGLD